MHIKTRTTCRVCGSSSLKNVIDLGPQYLQGSFIKPGKEMPSTRKIPCTLVRCNPEQDENACGLLQMEHSVPPEILYAAYWYRSGTNNTMRNHLKGIVDAVVPIIKKKDAIVLDIGCNDGTLLNFYPKGVMKYGIDPSDIAQEIKDEDATVVQDIFPSRKLEEVLGSKTLDVITSIAMFYDLENPVEFVRGIKQLLSQKGVWVFEMSYMPDMLRLDSFDTICHEHLEYYSLAVLEIILKKAGMRLFKISFNDINGGSIRCFATHEANIAYDSPEDIQLLNEIRQKEFDLELDTDKPYQAFWERIVKLKNELHALLVKLKNEGKKIHIYGASTKGNTILQWCNIDNSIIDYAAERNPDKYGAMTLGTNIPIISEADSRAMNPDYYLVLPWHFKEEFLEREKETLEKGIGLIFPLPKIEIYKK
ncbi:class I SAM-dependent methyltransferase [Paraflavitalea soli]|uniref:Class I SAM-dependent methyltransferase n=1 Tax=Paraflavitalea soli TaxID=2315862 RepID=A0A3B7MHX8_9BACT|nr:class I SAM-dependent methyltransferase [Paraflavitalea soli]AXY74002.1 class I SAM-dependent methyltransferase [Paraflavitalea soli]